MLSNLTRIIKENILYSALAAIVLVFIIFLLFHLFLAPEPGKNTRVPVYHGDLPVYIVESGEIRAVNAMFIKSPFDWRTELQILDMAPEGTQVKKGDFLVQFDTSALQEEYNLMLDRLAQARTELQRVETENASRLSTQESELKKSEYSLEASKLKVELMKYESGARQESARLQLMKDEIAFEEGQMKMESQKINAAMELQKAQFGVEQAEGWVEGMERTIDTFRITAPISGMVVYQELGGRNSPKHKAAIGDKPYPGQAIMSIPDLSEMEMVVQINEIDIDKVAIGQEAEVTLDAYPEKVFHGKVSFIARLVENKVDNEWWRHDEKKSVIKLPAFMTTIRIDSHDQVLKPGMTAQAQIVLDTVENTTFVETRAVFENENGIPVIFPEKYYPDPVEVTTGERNSRFIEISGSSKISTPVSIKPPDGNYYPLGYKAETERRWNEIAELKQHLDKLQKVDTADSSGTSVMGEHGTN